MPLNCSEPDSDQTIEPTEPPTFSPAQRRAIREEPFSHTQELQKEGATIYEFESGTEDNAKWFDTEKEESDIKALSKRKEVGSLLLHPCAHLSSGLEFKLEEPTGCSTKCTCNECWQTFYIPPFRNVAECPSCHAKSINIRMDKNVNTDVTC